MTSKRAEQDFVESGLFLSPECRPNVERSFDFVASVYGTKPTRSTLPKVDRVEFDIIASVYRDLLTTVKIFHCLLT